MIVNYRNYENFTQIKMLDIKSAKLIIFLSKLFLSSAKENGIRFQIVK